MSDDARRRRWAALPEMTRPGRTLLAMGVFLLMLLIIGWRLYGSIATVFTANLYLNGLIAFVFLVGVGYAFWQVLRLWRSIDWMEAFLQERPGFDLIEPPPLLASMAALLREREARKRLSGGTVRAILDSVGVRLDESREIARYIGALLIFLGLLGTFWGLSRTVPAVVDTIRSLGPTPGDGGDGASVFGRLMTGLEEQLGGMGTAFAASLLGLAGSLIVGFLDILAGHAQNRFYREFEEALSGITEVNRNDEGLLGRLGPLLERSADSMDTLARALMDTEEARYEANRLLGEASGAMSATAQRLASGETATARLADSHGSLELVLREAAERNRGLLGGMDEATRLHIRSIDGQMLRLLEEMAAGRQDAISELRAEIRALSRAISTLGEAARRPSDNGR